MNPKFQNKVKSSWPVAVVLTGPIAWACNLQVRYAMVTWACGSGRNFPLEASFIFFFLVSLIAMFLAVASWLNGGLKWPSDKDSGEEAHFRFLGVLGIMMNGFFALLIFAQEVPVWFLSPCPQ